MFCGACQSKLYWVTVFVTSGGFLVQQACRVSGSGISRQGFEVCVKGRKVGGHLGEAKPLPLTSVPPEQLLWFLFNTAIRDADSQTFCVAFVKS